MRRFPSRSLLFFAIGTMFLTMHDHSAATRLPRLVAGIASLAAGAIGLAGTFRETRRRR